MLPDSKRAPRLPTSMSASRQRGGRLRRLPFLADVTPKCKRELRTWGGFVKVNPFARRSASIERRFDYAGELLSIAP
jgi:hypothetical protein